MCRCEPLCPNPHVQVNCVQRLSWVLLLPLIQFRFLYRHMVQALSLLSSHAKQASIIFLSKKNATKPHLRIILSSAVTEMHLDTMQHDTMKWQGKKSSCQNPLYKLQANRQLFGCQQYQWIRNVIKQLRKAYSHAPGLKCLPNVKYRKVSFQGRSEQGHWKVFHLPPSPRAQGRRHPGGQLQYKPVSYNSQGWAHEDTGCFCYFFMGS